jgi:hypothetical protein
MRSSEFSRSTKEGRVDVLERLVHDGAPIGVLAYLSGPQASRTCTVNRVMRYFVKSN